MNKFAKYGLAAIFLGAAGAATYEANQLNDLVWSAPDVGGIESFRDGEIIDYVMELERRANWHEREDFARNLNVYFDANSATPSQVCLDTKYLRAGIYTTDPKSELLWKYIDENPVFKDFILESHGGDPTFEFNNRQTTYTHNDCDDSVRDQYADELKAVVQFRRHQLNL